MKEEINIEELVLAYQKHDAYINDTRFGERLVVRNKII